ncbi:riboflavin synthase [Microbacterium sp. kSW2-24]|jgi:riboflavin synthase|uniref:riboflavin synthase n=1 Tax=Microbacterium TaxID=33882 RepID=UPI001FFDB691|nr:riboflavin synthase [Microbacterium galbinum]MCK2022365.1 riboflavin synthase [Microbacterium galbinum]MCK2029154.1 riboflavin synthase [Microbacterium galbinum]
MFTGIIEEIGEITAISPSGDGWRLTVRAPKAAADAVHGESIAVSGVCLTVVASDADSFDADVMKQTLDVAALGDAAVGTRVNIEKAMPVGARLGGHIVQGHVDGVGTVLEVRPGAQWSVLRIGLPADLAPLVVDKGSISVDGTSLTVSAVSDPPSSGSGPDEQQWFEISLIPETLAATTLGTRAVGDRVNLETDILARHVERLLAFRTAPEGGSR